jgi:hypothetical protein
MYVGHPHLPVHCIAPHFYTAEARIFHRLHPEVQPSTRCVPNLGCNGPGCLLLCIEDAEVLFAAVKPIRQSSKKFLAISVDADVA